MRHVRRDEVVDYETYNDGREAFRAQVYAINRLMRSREEEKFKAFAGRQAADRDGTAVGAAEAALAAADAALAAADAGPSRGSSGPASSAALRRGLWRGPCRQEGAAPGGSAAASCFRMAATAASSGGVRNIPFF